MLLSGHVENFVQGTHNKATIAFSSEKQGHALIMHTRRWQLSPRKALPAAKHDKQEHVIKPNRLFFLSLTKKRTRIWVIFMKTANTANWKRDWSNLHAGKELRKANFSWEKRGISSHPWISRTTWTPLQRAFLTVTYLLLLLFASCQKNLYLLRDIIRIQFHIINANLSQCNSPEKNENIWNKFLA